MTDRPHAHRLDRLDRLANTLDAAFRVPGIGIRVGYDSIMGLIPGIGDAAAVVPAGWIVLESYRMGAPRSIIARQCANIGVDFVVGSIPLVGDLFDVGWKANRRNVALLRRHMDALPQAAPERDAGGHAARPTGAGRAGR